MSHIVDCQIRESDDVDVQLTAGEPQRLDDLVIPPAELNHTAANGRVRVRGQDRKRAVRHKQRTTLFADERCLQPQRLVEPLDLRASPARVDDERDAPRGQELERSTLLVQRTGSRFQQAPIDIRYDDDPSRCSRSGLRERLAPPERLVVQHLYSSRRFNRVDVSTLRKLSEKRCPAEAVFWSW